MSSYKVDYATLYGLYNDIKSARDTVKKNITAHKKAMMNLANTEAFKSNTSKGIAAFIGDIYPYCEKVYHQVVEEIYTSYVEYFQTYLNSIDTDNSAHIELDAVDEYRTYVEADFQRMLEVMKGVNDTLESIDPLIHVERPTNGGYAGNCSGIHDGLKRFAKKIEDHEMKYAKRMDNVNAMLANLNSFMSYYESKANAISKYKANDYKMTDAFKNIYPMYNASKAYTDEKKKDVEKFGKTIEEHIKEFDQNANFAEYARAHGNGKAAAHFFSADPVDLSTGNFIYEKRDVLIESDIPLEFTRFYNALKIEKTSILDGSGSYDFYDANVIGLGFTHNYNVRLINKDEDVYQVCMEDGHVITFVRDEADELAFENIFSNDEELKKTSDGYELINKSGDRYIFNAAGQLVRKVDSNDRGISLEYSEDNKLSKVSNDIGEFIKFNYNEENLIDSIETSTEKKITYEYKDGMLVSAHMPNSNVYNYIYSSDGQILEVLNSKSVITVKNEYDSNGRIIKQSFPDNSFMTYEYTENSVILTERNGSKTEYVHDELDRATRVIYPDFSKEEYKYGDKNQKIYVRDRNGFATRYAYDSKGNIIKKTDPLGVVTASTYDENNNVTSISVDGVKKIENVYDDKSNLIKTTTATGQTITFAYDAAGHVTKSIDEAGDVREFSYDDKGNVIELIEPDGAKISYEYDKYNRPIKSIDGNGNETRYVYDANDRLIKVINPFGDEATYEYNFVGKVTRNVDFDGNESRIDYNDLNLESKIIDKEGNEINLSYDPMWNISDVKLPGDINISYEYDRNNRLSKITYPEGGTYKMEYDANGNVIREEDAVGSVTKYEYDVLNRMMSKRDASGNVTKYRYDRQGNLIKEIDALGNETFYEYDAEDRLTAKIDKLGNKTEIDYAYGDKVARVTYPDGTSDEYFYKYGNMISSRLRNGEECSYEYDLNKNLTSQTNALGEKVGFAYDALNRLETITLPTGAQRCFEYDKVSNLITIIDENKNETHYEYSPNGNLIKVIDGLGNIAEYDYDALGNLFKVTRVGDEERLNQVTKYIWNKNGLVTDVINPAGERESYEYDLAGRMIKKTDRDGYETKIGYDKNGLLSRITYSDSSEVEFSYDALAHLKEMKDWNGTTSIVNDALGRALEVTDSNGDLVKYEWGTNGEKKKLIYPNGEEVSYNYNDRGLLSELVTGNGKVAYDYDAMGRIMSKSLPNGIVTTYEYNNIGRLSSLSHIGENIHDVYKYEYDSAGNKTAAIKTRENMPSDSGRFEYGYDALNQLISVTKDGRLQREYTYDAFGNRSSKKSYDVADNMIETLYKYNNKNQLLAETTGDVTKNYTYDLRGNIKTVTTGQDLIRNFTYDARNMLSEVSEQLNGITQKASYNYNGLGKRISQKIINGLDQNISSHQNNAQGINIPSDPEKVIRYTLDLTRDYHNMLTLSTELEGRNQADNFFYDFNVVGMSRAVGDDYFIQDDLGSPMSVINQRGELEEAYAYDEFGQEYGNIIDARERFQPLSYTGYQKEAVGDTYFAQARRYDASIGRFVSEDKVDTIIDSCSLFNKYAYCINNPYSYVDLNGLWPKFIEDHKEAIGIGLTVAGVVGGIAITALSGGAAAPFVAGALVGATGYLGDKIYNNEEATVGGFIASTGFGALTGLVNVIPGAGSKLVSTFGGKVLATGGKALASGVIEGAGKFATNYLDGKEDLLEGVAETAISAAAFSGVAEAIAIKKKGTIDTKKMRTKLAEELKNVEQVKDAAKTKWNPKITKGIKNAKTNLQKELTKANKLITVPENRIVAIERAFKRFDIKSDIVFSMLGLAEDGIYDCITTA